MNTVTLFVSMQQVSEDLPEGQVNWCATMPRLEGPESRHQKYFLQSRGCWKKPSSTHLKSVDEREHFVRVSL